MQIIHRLPGLVSRLNKFALHCLWCGGNHNESKRAMITSWKYFPRNWPFMRGIAGPDEFHTQRSVTRSFDVFFDLRLNKRLRKQPWGWWFETPLLSLWRQCNALMILKHRIATFQHLNTADHLWYEEPHLTNMFWATFCRCCKKYECTLYVAFCVSFLNIDNLYSRHLGIWPSMFFLTQITAKYP